MSTEISIEGKIAQMERQIAALKKLESEKESILGKISLVEQTKKDLEKKNKEVLRVLSQKKEISESLLEKKQDLRDLLINFTESGISSTSISDLLGVKKTIIESALRLSLKEETASDEIKSEEMTSTETAFVESFEGYGNEY